MNPLSFGRRLQLKLQTSTFSCPAGRLWFDAICDRGYLILMKFLTSITRDEDGVWVVECPAIPGCVSQGSTRKEALDNVREAIAACLEVRAERGMALTVETEQVEVLA